MKETPIQNILSKSISVLFNPVIIPLYIIVIMLSQGLIMPTMGRKVQLLFALLLVVNSVLVPGICIFLIRKVRYKSSQAPVFDNYRNRIFPMGILLLCYTVSLIILRSIPFIVIPKLFLFLCCISLTAALIASFHRNISLFAFSQGVALAFMVYLAYLMKNPQMTGMLCTAFLTAGGVAWARLRLGKHTGGETLQGFLIGFCTPVITILILVLFTFA